MRLLGCLWLAEAALSLFLLTLGQARQAALPPRELLAPTPDDATRLRAAALRYATPPPSRNASAAAAVLELVDAGRAPVPRAERFAAVRAGRGRVYFRHFRKCAGTSIRAWLVDGLRAILRPPARLALPGNRRTGQQKSNAEPVNETNAAYAEMEFSEFPVFCLAVAPRTVFVTCLRDPVARHVSEFYYHGYGKRLRGGPRNATAAAVQWRLWVAARGSWKRNAGHYMDNYYTRGLTGLCAPHIKNDERALSVCGGAWGAWGGGCRWDDWRVGRNVSAADLAFASAVLERFDVVLVTELLGRPRTVAHVARLLGFPPTAVLGHERKGHGHPEPDAETRAYLERDNAFDAALYRRAVDRLENATRASLG